MNHPLKRIVQLQKENQAIGIYSACTANPLVLEACMKRAKETNSILLIEATANQVDQYGGYTGMKPKDFVEFVYQLAKSIQFNPENIVLGGDHLGPLTFTKYDEEKAMLEASELIRQYVLAGFTKIHIDTSMKVESDDPNVRLSDEVIAKRGARLAKVAKEAFIQYQKEHPNALEPVYIVGSEVPIPGGAQGQQVQGIQVTKVEDFKKTVETFKKEFERLNLNDVWNNVIGVVVQPGVEEKDAGCTEYDRDKAIDLTRTIKEYQNLVFEGHSTDYQTKIKLRELVEDGIAILKVGPGLTFAMREALFSLAYIEKELYRDQKEKQSHFMEVLDEQMVKNPKYFEKYYLGSETEIALKRKFSFSDRCRYYMPNQEVEQAKEKLLTNLKDGVPLNLLSQFMPIQYTKVREGKLKNHPHDLIIDRITNTIDEYLYATHQE